MLSCVLNFGWGGVQASSAAEQINQRHKQQININSLTIHQARWNHEKRLKMQHNTNVSSVSRPQRKRDAQQVLPNVSAFGTFKRVGWPSCDGSYPIKGSQVWESVWVCVCAHAHVCCTLKVWACMAVRMRSSISLGLIESLCIRMAAWKQQQEVRALYCVWPSQFSHFTLSRCQFLVATMSVCTVGEAHVWCIQRNDPPPQSPFPTTLPSPP